MHGRDNCISKLTNLQIALLWKTDLHSTLSHPLHHSCVWVNTNSWTQNPLQRGKRGLVRIVQHFSRSAELPAVIGWFGYISPDTGLPCHKPLSSAHRYHHSLPTYLCITIWTNWSPTSLANQYQQLAHYARMYRMYQIPVTPLRGFWIQDLFNIRSYNLSFTMLK